MGPLTLARVHDVIGENELIIRNTSKVIRGTDTPGAVKREGEERQNGLIKEAIGETAASIQQAYLLLLGLSTHDISAMRELLGMPERVLYAAMRNHGRYLTAAFDYGSYVCHFETGVDHLPRFDGYLEVYGLHRVVRVQYDTPYVRNLPITLTVTEDNGQGGVIETKTHPTWGDPFVAQWEAFYDNVTNGKLPKTDPKDFRKDLELFSSMVQLMQASYLSADQDRPLAPGN